jgi:hypothetical protein
MIEVGVNLSDVHIVCSGEPTKEWNKLKERYQANFFFYPFSANSSYPSIARPNALKQHYRQFPALNNIPALYIDCDILFLSEPSKWLKSLLEDDIYYLSDTKWYTGYSYLKSKEACVSMNKEDYDTDRILGELCNRVGIPLQTVKENDDHSGGAQYLFKGIDAAFWEDVEKDCDTIYKYFYFNSPGSINSRYFNSESEGFQSFALGDMLAVLWNLWKRGKTTRIAKEMDFAWPGYSLEDKDRFNIYHNAGVSNDEDGLFYKGRYKRRIPYFESFEHLSQNRLSWLYASKIQNMKTKTCLI